MKTNMKKERKTTNCVEGFFCKLQVLLTLEKSMRGRDFVLFNTEGWVINDVATIIAYLWYNHSKIGVRFDRDCRIVLVVCLVLV